MYSITQNLWIRETPQLRIGKWLKRISLRITFHLKKKMDRVYCLTKISMKFKELVLLYQKYPPPRVTYGKLKIKKIRRIGKINLFKRSWGVTSSQRWLRKVLVLKILASSPIIKRQMQINKGLQWTTIRPLIMTTSALGERKNKVRTHEISLFTTIKSKIGS
mgnify:CR=1 FL=1